jgi:tetratricopeptide (TPR) repeat protein
MKKPSDQIFQLIHSMSAAEKRYFKVHFASPQNMLTGLFDFINNQQEYDEEAVKDYLGEGQGKNLKVHKAQLQELILRSLVSCHAKKSIKSQIRMLLEEAELLMDKQLLRLAENRLEKARKICLEYEEFTYLIEIAHISFYLQHIKHEKGELNKLPLFGEVQQAIDHLQKHLIFGKLSIEVTESFKVRKQESFSSRQLGQFRQVLESDLLKIDPAGLSFRARLSRNSLLTALYEALGMDEEQARMRWENVELFRQNPQFKEQMAFPYIGALRNYANYCFETGKYEELEEIIREAERFISRIKCYEAHFIHFLYLDLRANYRRGRFQANIERLESRIIELIKTHQIERERIAGLAYFFLALSHMAQNRHKEVQVYLRRLRDADFGNEKYLEELLDIIELVSHMETGDDFLVERLLLSIYRRNKAQNLSSSSFYPRMLNWFRDALRNPFDKPGLAAALKKEFDCFPDDRTFLGFKFFRLDQWVEAVACKRTFADQLLKGTAAD